jgi:hypothetical protein
MRGGTKSMKLRLIFYLCCFVVAVVFLYLSFSNPDMTETRLFITYWQLYVSGIGLLFVLFLLSRLDDG